MKATIRIWLTIALVMAAAFALPSRAPAAPTATTALAADAIDHVVHAGAKDSANPLNADMFEAFLPRQLSVHKGDRVRWEFPNQGNGAQAFHTVTFGKPDDLPFVRADEIPDTLAFNERTFFTSGCGRPGQPVCVISSRDQYVSSGTPIQHSPGGVGAIQPFDAVIDLPEGTYTYFCTLHHPTMQGTIDVVADDVALNNQKPEDFAGEVAATAAAATKKFREQKAELTIEEGRRVWTMTAGGRAHDRIPVTTEAFLPGTLNIKAGDTVRWVMDGTVHTVTFPDSAPGGAGPPQHLMLNCEFDQPAAGAPGIPAVGTVGATGLLWCPPGGGLEMGLTPLAANQQRAPGDAVVSGATLHNSGLLLGGFLPERMRGRPAGSGKHFPSQFEATFPVPGTYTYRCLMHWAFMGGSIAVGE